MMARVFVLEQTIATYPNGLNPWEDLTVITYGEIYKLACVKTIVMKYMLRGKCAWRS